MATPAANGNYSLAALCWACDSGFQTIAGSADDNRALTASANGGTAGGPAADVAMSDFMVDGVAAPGSVSLASSTGSATYSMSFSNAESRFSERIKVSEVNASGSANDGPFSWNESTSLLSIQGGSGEGINDFDAVINHSNLSSSTLGVQFTTRFEDHYNTTATNYGSVLTTNLIIPGGGGGRGGRGGGEGGGGRSDIRLKENIIKVGKSQSNIPIYEFNYIGESERYQGAMAQDLLNMNRGDAVILTNKGYFNVLYNRIDVEFKKIEDSADKKETNPIVTI